MNDSHPETSTPQQAPPSLLPVVARRGILTIATGAEKYFGYAASLRQSLRRHSPAVQTCLATDQPAHKVGRQFDYVSEMGGSPSFSQKVSIDGCSPFAETIFLDGDCLAVRDVAPLFDQLLADTDFAVAGRQRSAGRWFMDIAEMCRRLDVVSIPVFNGGLYAWRRGDQAGRVFASARDFAARYDELGLERIRGSVPDEVVFALALAVEGIEPVEDRGSTMRTPIGIEGPLKVDALLGRADFVKEGTRVQPAVVHFAGWTESLEYRREATKLRLAAAAPHVDARLLSRACDVAWAFVAIRQRLGLRTRLRSLSGRRRSP